MNEILNQHIDDLLEKFDDEEYPELYDYLISLLTEEENPELLLSNIEYLNNLKPVPQVVWDFVIDILEIQIKDGNDDAMNDLGAMYYGGTGCKQSFEKAVYYYKMAADNGNRQAQENLGYCYYYGRNMPVDYEKAFHYFAKGAFDDHLISLYKIGDMYANGYYVKKDLKEAFLIYNRCTELMTDESAPIVAGPVYLRLGKAFLYGRGTEENAEAALVFYQKAEVFLYNMVKNGDIMYKKSLDAAIKGQSEARKKLAEALPVEEWNFD